MPCGSRKFAWGTTTPSARVGASAVNAAHPKDEGDVSHALVFQESETGVKRAMSWCKTPIALTVFNNDAAGLSNNAMNEKANLVHSRDTKGSFMLTLSRRHVISHRFTPPLSR